MVLGAHLRYKAVLVPEMNMGQLTRILRSEYPSQNFLSYSKGQGQPFHSSEIAEKAISVLEN